MAKYIQAGVSQAWRNAARAEVGAAPSSPGRDEDASRGGETCAPSLRGPPCRSSPPKPGPSLNTRRLETEPATTLLSLR